MDANCKNCSIQAIYIGNDDDDFNEGDIVIKICIINTRTNKQTRYGQKSENFWDIWLAEYLRYSFAELGTNGLIRDQRYRTDHDAGMPMPD